MGPHPPHRLRISLAMRPQQVLGSLALLLEVGIRHATTFLGSGVRWPEEEVTRAITSLPVRDGRRPFRGPDALSKVRPQYSVTTKGGKAAAEAAAQNVPRPPPPPPILVIRASE